MTKKAVSKKSLVSAESSAKKTSQSLTSHKLVAEGFVRGDLVKCVVDIGPVKAGTIGTVMQPFPEADASTVLFVGTSGETLVPNRCLKPVVAIQSRALPLVAAVDFTSGDQVRCTEDIGPVKVGTAGTVQESVPIFDASMVLFDGTSSVTLVPNSCLEPA